jgi:glucokinase
MNTFPGVPKMTTVTVGIDLGGTKVCAVLVSETGAVRHRFWQRHEVRDYDSAITSIERAVTHCLAIAETRSWQVGGIGVAIAAWLGADRGQVLEAANLGFTRRPLRADLRSRFGLPLSLVNDADAAALAEARFGAATGEPVLVLLTLGTGVGGGIVADGRLATGASGLAAELGHIRVTDGAPDWSCVCGTTGCLETVASGPAVARRGSELVAAGKARVLRDIAGENTVTSKDVVAAAKAGDDAANGLLAEAGDHVGTALAMIASVLDPSVVLLGGGLATGAGDVLLDAARDGLRARLSLAHLRAAPPIRLATFGAEAGAVGAAAFATHSGN